MLCTDCSRQLKECVTRGLLTEDQLGRILGDLGRTELVFSTHKTGSSRQEAKKSFNPIMVAYYLGALMILAAFGWLLDVAWDGLGPVGLLGVSSFYALLFGFLGYALYFRGEYPIAGGLLITCCVGMVPLIVYCLQALTGIWPKDAPGSYHDYYLWVNGSWIVMELATIAAAFAALRKIRFSFLVMPAAIAFWFLSMDLAEIIIPTHQLTWEMRSWVSVVVGLLILVIGFGMDRVSEGIDYAFWIYLAGLLSFWGGLTSLPNHNEFGRFVYCLISLGLVGISLKLQRKSFAVFGAFGFFGYLGHLAWTVFEGSLLFPVALAFLGLMMILSTVYYQKHYSSLRDLLGSQK